MRRLVEDLLDAGRFEAGAEALRTERLDLGELVRAIVAEFLQQPASHGFSIELNVSEEVWGRLITLSRDGRTLVYLQSQSEGDVWLMTLDAK